MQQLTLSSLSLGASRNFLPTPVFHIQATGAQGPHHARPPPPPLIASTVRLHLYADYDKLIVSLFAPGSGVRQ